MKYKSYAVLAVCLAVAGYAACRLQGTTSSSVSSTASSSVKLTSSSYSDLMKLDSEDSDESFNASSSTVITLNGSTAEISGSGAELKDDTITLTKAGTFVLSGTFSGSIEVNCTASGTVRIVMNGASITSNGSAAIAVQQADKTIITSAAGSENSLSDSADTSDTSDTSDEEEITATVFSHDDLVINGSGSLTVTANQNDGIASKDSQKLVNANITVNAADDGIIGKDFLYTENSSLNINCTGDGIKSTNDTDENSGIALVNGGDIVIEAGDDGIQTVSAAVILDGSVAITSGGGYENASTNHDDIFGGGNMQGGFSGDGTRPSRGTSDSTDGETAPDNSQGSLTTPDMNSGASADQSSADPAENMQTPPDMNIDDQNSDAQMPDTSTEPSTSEDSEEKSKGITSEILIEINGGTVTINSADDALNSAGNITVNGGTINISAGDDGMHADDTLAITDGTVTLSESYEGLEATYVNLIGGDISVTSSDDGINTSNKLSTTSVNGGFDSDDGSVLTISGGRITVNADGDGIDMNGSGTMTNGTIIVNGPTNSGNGALDCAGTFDFNGGTLYAGGASGMVVVPSDSSTCYSLDIGVTNSGTVTVKDSSGNTIASYSSSKTYQNVVIASDQFKSGETYTIYENDSELGTATISDAVTYVNTSLQSQNMIGGGQKGQSGMGPGGSSSDSSSSDAGGMQPDSSSGATAENGDSSSQNRGNQPMQNQESIDSSSAGKS